MKRRVYVLKHTENSGSCDGGCKSTWKQAIASSIFEPTSMVYMTDDKVHGQSQLPVLPLFAMRTFG